MKKTALILILVSLGYSNSLDNYLKSLENEVKKVEADFKGFSYQRGKEIFFKKSIGKRGKEISCASCHTDNLNNIGKNIFTGKKIKPLSQKANKKRLTDIKKVKKWLRRNFKDVFKREGTAKEKGDVLIFIRDFKE